VSALHGYARVVQALLAAAENFLFFSYNSREGLQTATAHRYVALTNFQSLVDCQ
jgi:hypothetical protein